MSIEVNQHACGHIVRFSSADINQTKTARKIAGQISNLLESSRGPSAASQISAASNGTDQPSVIEIDLGEITFLSSAAINELISINQQVRARGVSLILQNTQETVYEIFELTRLDRMFDFAEDAPRSNQSEPSATSTLA